MPSDLAAAHPELFHFTSIAGLEGIIKSQTLRATHAAYLNDAAEIRAFQTRLPQILYPGVAKGIQELVRRSPEKQVFIDQYGGTDKAIEEISDGMATGMIRTLIGEGESFAPFVTSFCTTSIPDVSQHGLLSQWRGYGHEGGYAIVFDTDRLGSLLKEEGTKWQYDLFGGDVIYSSDSDGKIIGEFGQAFENLAASMEKFLASDGDPKPLEETYVALTRCACRYKHWGFHEEKEVRIVAIPTSKKLSAMARADGLAVIEKPQTVFIRGSAPIPCINLFEGITKFPDKVLPITRIIVGPHRDKDKRRRAVEILLNQYGLDATVSVSDIPYVAH